MRSRGLFLVFSVAVLLPGVALAVLGTRALMHERRLAAYDAHERLDLAADAVLREVESELREWRWALERVPLGTPGASTLPASLRGAFTPNGSLLLLLVNQSGQHWWPQNGLLYSIGRSDDGADGAAPGMVQPPASTARLLHRRGRALREAGNLTAAVDVFDELRHAPDSVGAVPGGLVGRYEVCATWAHADDRIALASCAAAFYTELVTGQWLLPSERYIYYSVKARAWLHQSGTDAGQIVAVERLETIKRTLTEAARTLQSMGCDDAAVSPVEPRLTLLPHALAVDVCAPADGGGIGSALIVSTEWLDAQVWPRVTRDAARAGYHVALIAQDGREIFATAAARPRASAAMTRDGTGMAHRLRVLLWPQDPERLAAASVARQRWYTGVLALVALSLLLGAYAMTRLVRRELQVAQMKSDFVATVSHELRTPVTAIRQLGELLLRGRVPELRRRDYYERITQESDRLGLLIDNVLDVARMDAGRKHYHFQPLETSTWLRETLDAFRSMHESTDLTLTSAIPDSLPMLEADAIALGSAVHNLLDNAVKYSPERSTVWVEAEGDGHGVTIRIRDQGVGIADDERQRVFERFYRTQRDVSRTVRGAGLGLSLVQHVVSAHKGHVGLESRLGSGSTFSIHLPAAPSRS